MVAQHIILTVGWVVFGILHSLFAGISFKQWIARKMKKSFQHYRLYYTLFAFVSFAIILLYQLSIPSPYLYSTTTLSSVAGMIIGVSGLLVMIICIKKYFGKLSGLKTLFQSEIKTGNTLIITGIHRFVRHPLYTGTFLFIWGLFIFMPYCSLLISNFIITIYTLIGIRFEENKLIREFGTSYIEYRKKVPKIIPAIKPSAAS